MRFVQVNDIASVASELATALRKRGHEVDLYYPRLYGASLPPIGKVAVAPFRFLDWLRLAWRVRKGQYDAVHIHYGYLGVVGLIAGVPYVLHCHGDDVRDINRRVWAPLIKLAIRRARHVYYSTPDLREELIAIRPDAEFLPNPIDVEAFRPIPVPPDALDVFIACALSENKGVEHILEACQTLAVTHPNVRITAVSGGEASPAFDALANVVLLVRQPRAKLPGLMGRHRVIVGQVHQGAVGMVELESMACGRPVVCDFRFQDAFSEPAPFVQAHEGAEIVEAVLALLADPADVDRVGALGRHWVVRHHNADVMAERVEELAKSFLR